MPSPDRTFVPPRIGNDVGREGADVVRRFRGVGFREGNGFSQVVIGFRGPTGPDTEIRISLEDAARLAHHINDYVMLAVFNLQREIAEGTPSTRPVTPRKSRRGR